MSKLSELKLPKVRKVLTYEVNGEEKVITIHNPIGKKREELVEMLQKGAKLISNKDKDETAELLYQSILKELVDIEVDIESINPLMEAPSITLLELNHEIGEILFELQYDFFTEQVRQLNMQKISILTAASLEKVAELQEEVKNIKNANI